ncbi:MAG: phosphopantetheinyl transferase [Candidatus Angelobacter sp. Gp1-AA117]|nr:MAG: phosphopantetheinyl transferase [Candidatus Angelobacter sp. Gp1-AA117]
MIWATAAEIDTLEPHEVHLWRVHLIQPEAAIQGCRALLAPDELARANRFHFAKDRNRFTIARAMLRNVLGRYLKIRPQQVGFTYGAQEKPDLKPELNPRNFRFNLSHSGEYALLAVTPGLEVGVDIELFRPDFGTQEIADRFFSPREAQILLALPAEQKVEAFFKCWTRKEAYVKALGGGLSIPLDSFDIAFAPGETPALLRVAGRPEEIARWRLYNLEAAPNYAAALLVEGQEHQLKYFNWALEMGK